MTKIATKDPTKIRDIIRVSRCKLICSVLYGIAVGWYEGLVMMRLVVVVVEYFGKELKIAALVFFAALLRASGSSCRFGSSNRRNFYRG